MDFLNKGKAKLINNKKATAHKFNEINTSILSILGDSWNYMPPVLVPSSAKPSGT